MAATNKETATAHSPLSTLPPKKIRDLPKSFLLGQLELYYGAKPPAQVVECDYSLWECAETGLQFSWPMLPGNVAFYEWVSSFESYYPGRRWEYGKVRAVLEAEDLPGAKSFKVLDVGCGKGGFLRGLDSVSSEGKFALDLNEPAVNACRQQGFHAFCGTVETAMEAGFLKAAEFSMVTSFHCLEHVPEPVAFVRALLKIVAPGGRVLVSTPYSPMSFESDCFDIMNHPPHHMTRWNLSAYQRLAALLGTQMRFFVPRANTARNALRVFRLKQYGPNRRVGKARLLKNLLRRLPTFLGIYQKQKERARTNRVGGADVILVEFKVS